ncbi:hypothetical protein [Methylobacterium durans]|uniref:hypothetical protein n=1 Tax=Methylobacterium durans TaxID=2202825 RepID=UPI0013A5335F|nr:hypothetical protein [Methylobacterium durans]
MTKRSKTSSKAAPAINSDAWKTFVADAIAKHPHERPDAERAAKATAMAMHRAGGAVKR